MTGKRSHGAFDGKLAALRSKLRTGASPHLTVARFRDACKRDELLYYAQRLNELPEAKTYAMGIPFPRTLAEVRLSHRQGTLDAEEEWLWSACQIRLFAKELASFLSLEKRIEAACLTGYYSEARNALEEIKNQFGYSLWYLETLIGILELSEGLDAQKTFVQKITKDEELPGELRAFVYFFSLRAEKSVSPERYQSILRNTWSRVFDDTDASGQYYAFRLNFFGAVRFRDPISVLLHERNSSIIDRYLTFIRLMQVIIADPDLFGSHTSYLKAPLKLVISKIADNRLFNIAKVLAIDCHLLDSSLTRSLVSYVDSYSAGEYEQCVKRFGDLSKDLLGHFEMFEVSAKAAARLAYFELPKSLSESNVRFLVQLRDIILKTDGSQDAYHELQKLCFVFQCHSWVAQLFTFLMREHQHGSYTIPERYILLGDLNGIPLNPRIGSSIKSQRALEKFFSHLIALSGASLSANLYMKYAQRDAAAVLALVQAGLPESRANKYAGHAYAANRQFRLAEEEFIALCRTGNTLDYQDGLEGLAQVFLDSGQSDRAVETIVDGILKNPHMKVRLPIDKTLASIERNKDAGISKNIAVPVLYDIYTRSIGGERDVRRSLAYEEFLNGQGFARPSHIRSQVECFDLERLKYFLRYVCVVSVMDTSIEFDSSEDIENERIAICQMLTELDPENAAFYSEEIKGITQRLMINRGMREIERGKIHVDIEGIKASVELEGKDIFARFRSFQNSKSLASDAEEIILALSRLVDSNKLQVILPGDEKLEAFKQFYNAIRDAFVSSNEYGLDGYLSVGIRHGTLSGQLRSAFEREDCVTQRDNRAVYKENIHWRDVFVRDGLPASTISKAVTRFADFSKKIDDLINRIRNEEFQIKTEGKNQNGLFDYSLSTLEVFALQRKITPTSTYEEAVDCIVEKLWELTDRSLQKVRARIAHYKSQFTNEIDLLQQDIRLHIGANRHPALDDALARSRTAIQEELDKVGGWFTRSSGENIADFQAHFPIDIALRTVNNIHPNRIIDPTREIVGERLLSGKSLRSLAGIVIMLFENAITHSRLPNSPQIEVKCICDQTGFELCIANEIGPDVRVDTESEKVKTIINEITKARRSTDMVKKEGGSGFYKIAKILKTDLGCEFEFDAYFEDKGRFVFNLKILSGRIFV